jgi:hypothetical protein
MGWHTTRALSYIGALAAADQICVGSLSKGFHASLFATRYV